MAPAIAAHDVAFAPPGSATPVISGVTLEIARGEWVALAGPNGSGKTTLALGLAGLVPLRRGRVERATGRGPAGGLRVATILQEPATQATQPTVREEIAFTAINLGVDRVHAFEQALRWSRILDLDPLLDLAPGALSAGQLQKVLFAAAFATDPELLIADEAAAHLDARERQRVLELVRVRVAEGLAVLWITQREEDHAWSDRVVVLPGPEPHTGGTARSV